MNRGTAHVASGDPLVSETALEILREGGNAYDAVIAAGFVSSLAEPTLTSLGGGGFLLAHPADNEPVLFDFFSDTPGRGLHDEELEPHFFPVTVHFANSDQDFNIGLGSVAVPGVLKGFLHVHRRLGRLPLAEILAPTIEACRRGIQLGKQQADFLGLLQPIMTLSPEGQKLYSPSGTYFKHGDVLRNHELASFLEALLAGDTADFYQGELATRIDHEMRQGNGLLTIADLAAYQVIERRPLACPYRGGTLLTNPPPSFGGALIGQALRCLDACFPSRPAPLSEEYITAHAAVMLHIDEQRMRIGSAVQSRAPRFSRGTTHISVVDTLGNAAAMTTSNGEGSGYIIPGTGIMLNNMMGEDDLHPEGFHAALPGMRVSSMMSPSLFLEKGKTRIVIGSGGSKRIRSAICQVLTMVIDCKIGMQEAIDAPRIHWDGTIFQVEPGIPEVVMTALGQMGKVKRAAVKNVYFGGVHGIIVGKEAGADQRRGGAVRSLL